MNRTYDAKDFQFLIQGTFGKEVRVQLRDLAGNSPNDILFEEIGAWRSLDEAIASSSYWMAQSVDDRVDAGDADEYFAEYTKKQWDFVNSKRREDLVELSNLLA